MVDEYRVDENRLARKTRQERRTERLAKEKARIPQHGKGLVKVYKDAVSKRARGDGSSRKSG
ncbi:MAG: hypothetical protein ACNA7X_00630 [Dehalococcoidia bacterium]